MYLGPLLVVYGVYVFLIVFCVIISTQMWIKTLMGTSEPVIDLHNTPKHRIQEEEENHPSTLRVMSFNIFLRSWYRFWRDNPCNEQSDYTHERFDAWCEYYLPHYDIICLQEMYGIWNRRLQTLVKRAKTQGFHIIVVPSDSMLQIDNGMCIISRVRPCKVQTQKFNDALYCDKYSPKGFQHCVFPTRTGFWHLIHTHIQSSYSYIDPKAIQTQHKQFRQLGKYIEQQCFPGDPLILLGDLSTCRKSDLEYLLQLCELKEAWKTVHPHENRIATTWSTVERYSGKEIDTRYRSTSDLKLVQKDWLCIPRYFDHILYRPGTGNTRLEVEEYEICALSSHKAHIQRLSDHAAVTATIRFITEA